MTLLQLEYVVAVDLYQSFNAAANHCEISQPTLTFQVQKLEQELGLEFFDRSTLPITTTVQGQQILKVAKVILKECNTIYKLAGLSLAGRTKVTGMRAKPSKKLPGTE